MRRVLAVAERARHGAEERSKRSMAHEPWRPWRWWVPGMAPGPTVWGARAFDTGDATATRWATLRGDLTLSAVNLLPPDPRPGEWDAPRARERAADLRAWALAGDVSLVLLGRRVERAVMGIFAYTPLSWGCAGGASIYPRLLVLPHPSGRCRVWNDAAEAARLRARLREFVQPANG